MNMHKKLLAISLFFFLLIQNPINANIYHENQARTFSDGITPTIYTAAALYIGYNYLIREEYLVKNKFPVAQCWYEAMTAKYPAANFSAKEFVQKPQFSLIPDILRNFAYQCSWITHHDHIYFSEHDLKEITYLYQKVIDGHSLQKIEQFALARQEFILLHEAGHIEHNDAQDIMITIVNLLATIYSCEYIYDTYAKPTHHTIQKLKNLPCAFKMPCSAIIEVPGILTSMQGTIFITGLISLLRYQELRADQFACKIADIATLEGAISLFENEHIDQLYDLENKTMTPFIQSKSKIGTMIQTIVGPIEFIASVIIQQLFLIIKSMPETRLSYNFVIDPTHIAPYLRAQAIKGEIAQRENNKQKRD